MDETKIEALQERLFTQLNSGMSMLTLQLGYQLGYFKSLSEEGPSNVRDFAMRTGTNERYARVGLCRPRYQLFMAADQPAP